jgi:Protein of unknown function (DUF2442)
MPTLVDTSEALAVEVSCSDDALSVVLDDGRTISVPLMWFPRLLNASHKERKDWELIGGGIGIHWEAIDEGISVASLLRPEKFMRLSTPRLQPTALPPSSHRGAASSARKKRPLGAPERRIR